MFKIRESDVVKRVHIDPVDRRYTFEQIQDVEPIIERNKKRQSMPQKSDWARHIAEIPCVIMTRWLNEEWSRGNSTIKLFGPEMDALIAKKLRDPEWKWLRNDGYNFRVGYGK